MWTLKRDIFAKSLQECSSTITAQVEFNHTWPCTAQPLTPNNSSNKVAPEHFDGGSPNSSMTAAQVHFGPCCSGAVCLNCPKNS